MVGMKLKYVSVIVGLVIVLLLSGCNPHSTSWDRESCYLVGYAPPATYTHDDIVKCRDGCMEVGIHYKEMEAQRERPREDIRIVYKKSVCMERVKKEVYVHQVDVCVNYAPKWNFPACAWWCNGESSTHVKGNREQMLEMCVHNCEQIN